MKKENRKRRKIIEAYQEMLNHGATGLHPVRYTYMYTHTCTWPRWFLMYSHVIPEECRAFVLLHCTCTCTCIIHVSNSVQHSLPYFKLFCPSLLCVIPALYAAFSISPFFALPPLSSLSTQHSPLLPTDIHVCLPHLLPLSTCKHS